MKFKLLKPRRRRRPKKKPLPPEAFAEMARRANAQHGKTARQASRRQTLLRLACVREITLPRTVRAAATPDKPHPFLHGRLTEILTKAERTAVAAAKIPTGPGQKRRPSGKARRRRS